MTEKDIIILIQHQVKRAGSMRALARDWNITVSYVSDLLNGRRAPGPKVLGPLGIEVVKTTTYRRKTS